MSARQLLVLSLVLTSCGTQYPDPVRAADAGASGMGDTAGASAMGGSGGMVDPCASWHTEDECNRDTVHHCSLQPNDVGCVLNDAGCAPGICSGANPFVRRVGASLLLKGQPFRFVGTNAWGVAWADAGCRYGGFPDQDAALTKAFSELTEMHVQVLRVWAFQAFAGPNGNDYSALERVVQYARSAGIRLIFVLENMSTDCSKGRRDDSWFQTGYAAPYGGYALSFPAYVDGLVVHFSNEPTVFAWELMHEAGGNDASAMLAFSKQMSGLVHSKDMNHLIVLGTNNGDTRATSTDGNPSPYATLQGLDSVDLIDSQDFSSPDAAVTVSEQTDLNVATSLQKPCFIGASAISLGDTSAAAFSARANRMSAKIQGALDAGFAGFLVYAYTPGWQTPGLDFDGRSADPLSGVVAKFATSLRGP